ncbi:MAG: hypothetical protein C0392_01320 [Syntrophus sp. (in: bacteria)]|nr:hypothetical protein [Syntrophus sp. (in: bacteria)]
MGKYFFLASALPAMPVSLGDQLSLPFSDIARIVLRNIEPQDLPLAKALLMKIDISNFEAIHQDRDVFIDGGMLTRDEIEHKQNLPLFIQSFLDEKERGVHRPYLFDALWERYYEYVYSLGQEMECRFLIDYISWDISLRNHLVMVRAKESTREEDNYTLASHIGTHDLSAVLAQLRNQRGPLLAERMLDEERLRQLFHCEGSDPFSVDAILSTIEKARIFERWEKMNLPFMTDATILFKGGVFDKHNG